MPVRSLHALMVGSLVRAAETRCSRCRSSENGRSLAALSFGWVGNVLIINQGVLRDSGNTLRIASGGDEFVVDNVVVVYKTRTGPVIVGETSQEARSTR
jgi:hypothetical protein